MRYPKVLKKGDTIGLVGISGAMRPTTPERVAQIAQCVEAMGYRVKLDESVGQVYGYLSGTDEMRAGAVNRMFADESVDAIWAVRGGYGVTRMLDRLDYDMIRANMKPFIGYSDITALHAQLQTKCDMISFHGPMPSSDGMEPDGVNARSLVRALEARPLGVIENPDGTKLKGLNGGQAEGEFVGGNLSLVATMCGTPYALDVKGKILFLEDVGEKIYALDRMFTQLRNAGYFDACAGIVLGGYTDCVGEDAEYGFKLNEVIADVIVPCGKPILTGLQAGHLKEKITLPLGAQAVMDADAATLRFV